MDSLPQPGARNYTPHLYQTRLHSCKRIRESHWEVWKVLSYYHVKRSSLYRWLRRFDEFGEEGLRDRSHKPKTPHPSTISPKAAYKVKCFHDQAGKHNWSSVDIWVKTVSSGFPVSYSTVLRYIKRLDGYKPYQTNPKRHCKKYRTPPFPGDKWQMDVKFVPSECRSPKLPADKSYYQYTVLDALCHRQGIHHKLIRPRTPEHNGKVERSHRIDQERFYQTLSFHSLGDLREQGSRWMKRYNSAPRLVLGLMTPDQMEFAKLRELLLTAGEIRCPKLGRRLTSSDS